jgi:FHS family L-fucose permease-like MFS transporter
MLPRKSLLAFGLITSCFAWWGLANNMTDTLLAAFKRIQSLTDFQTSLIQIAFYGAYFCFALPAALFLRRFSYKAGILLGLGIYIFGGLLFWPASQTMVYAHFLIALYVLAGGLAILETSANPYVLKMGDPASATRRLNFAQAFNPAGSILGVFLSQQVILSQLQQLDAAERAALPAGELQALQAQELSAVMLAYVGVSALLVLVWVGIASVRLPVRSGFDAIPGASEAQRVRRGFLDTAKRLLKRPSYVSGIAAQFVYVGAQIGVWSFTIRYVMHELAITEAEAASWYLAALLLFGLFRFICTALMTFLAPERLLLIASLAGALLTLGVVLGGGLFGCACLVAISATMSLMFPTIFGIALEGVDDEDAKLAGSGLIMAILGGAVLTAIQGAISTATTSIATSYAVPLVAFLAIALFAHRSQRRHRMTSAYPSGPPLAPSGG